MLIVLHQFQETFIKENSIKIIEEIRVWIKQTEVLIQESNNNKYFILKFRRSISDHLSSYN